MLVRPPMKYVPSSATQRQIGNHTTGNVRPSSGLKPRMEDSMVGSPFVDAVMK